MALPLSDIRVVEICQVFAGPMAGMLLADQGADVIKIEPLDGDSSRPAVPYLPEVDGTSVRYVTFNRNKRSIVLDIAKPKGREVVYDLLRRADVMTINMRLGARQRAGLTYEQVAAVNPRVVYASITGYGEEGPDADLPGIDIVTQARSGDLAARRISGGVLPPHTQLYHFDMSAPMLLVYGVMLALRQREVTGAGQKVDTSLLQAAIACHTVNMTRRAGSTGNYGIVPTAPATYRCGDGKYILAMSGGERWERLCHIMGLDHLLKDPAYDTNQKRTQKAEEIFQILTRQFATKPAAEWEALLKADGHTVSVVKEMSEVYEDTQVVANGMFIQMEQPGLGAVTVTNVPFQMSATAHEPHLRSPAPALGEHTVEVLQELGRSPDEIGALRAEGVIP
ncbi:MAG: CoA transferase [Dehalococcoidia bacterium]|nr:CoA transferase [Dehalococcoidia bacterium]